MRKSVFNKVMEQETILIRMMERFDRLNIKKDDNKTWQYERAKMIGMMDMLDVIGIDRKQFNWIF